MRDQKKSQAVEPVQCPSRTSVLGRRDRRHQVPKGLQPGAIPPNRRNGGHRGSIPLRSAPEPLSAKLGRKPPRFPLTLRAMLGSRHRPARGWDRSVFLLPSVLAVLAFALFPVAASADSSGYEYGTETPSPTGNHKSTPTVVGGGDDEKAHGSTNGGDTSTDDGGSGSGGSSSDGDAGTGAGMGAGEDKGGNGSTKPEHANANKDAGEELGLKTSSPVDPSDDGGGSSPLVPILIVIALLAAASVGAVLWQRRRGDASVSPKAS